MALKIESLSARELTTLINQAKKRKEVLVKRKSPASVRAKVNRLLKEEGYTVEELFGTGGGAARPARASKKTAGRKTAKVAPKYRNPANPKETWTGRGRQPRWLTAYTDQGRSRDDFLIK